ncbi:DUF5753 domain-containing protein [Streptomyces sp. UG1]|uniref:DUF5753 domain-containing protein n=1 Tax=Streptomyces sp. UG1 TaxID=3417652 RepID=UPI003CEF2D22
MAEGSFRGIPFLSQIERGERGMPMDLAWAPTVIPGLLQTEPYMRVLMRHARPLLPRELIEQRVSARLARAELWDREERPTYWGILRESAVRTPLLPPEQMAEQLEHIVNVIRATERALQVIPRTTTGHPLMHGMAKIMTFADAPPLVWTEGSFDGRPWS